MIDIDNLNSIDDNRVLRTDLLTVGNLTAYTRISDKKPS